MTVHHGKVNEYLSIELYFSTTSVLNIGMIKYIKKIHKDFPEEIKSPASTPVAEHLFVAHKAEKILQEW